MDARSLETLYAKRDQLATDLRHAQEAEVGAANPSDKEYAACLVLRLEVAVEAINRAITRRRAFVKSNRHAT